VKRILIVGATSAIAEATARRFAARGDSLFLVGRNALALQAIADDLRLRGAAEAASAVFDAREPETFAPILAAAVVRLGGLDAALIAHGSLSNQGVCEASVEALREEFVINTLSVITISLLLSRHFTSQGQGVIAAISSVAGDRGRKSNYIYGASKAAVSTFLSGLRQQLYASGVRVVTIKPGFVDTPMTAAFKKGALWATPAQVARDIVRGMDRGTPVLYTPWFWRPIMAVVRFVPERMFRRIGSKPH
jgi:decaprenylphospho-beta-D-erythro-pentofuranosid-2-ulose 2-reductase